MKQAGWLYKHIVDKHLTGTPLENQILMGGVWGTPSDHLHFSPEEPTSPWIWWKSPVYFVVQVELKGREPRTPDHPIEEFIDMNLRGCSNCGHEFIDVTEYRAKGKIGDTHFLVADDTEGDESICAACLKQDSDAEIAKLRAILGRSIEWWLREGMHQFSGAPEWLFAARNLEAE